VNWGVCVISNVYARGVGAHKNDAFSNMFVMNLVL